MAELVFVRRGEELMRVALDRPRVLIGRGAHCDVSIPHPEVSRSHVAIERSDEGFTVVDLSGRGTVVAGAPVERAALREGMELALGDFRVLFRSGGGADTSSTVADRELTQKAGAKNPVPEGSVLRVRRAGRETTVALVAETTIGKDPGCTVPLDDAFVSGVHCRLSRRGEGVVLQDLNSTNGTWVNGLRVGHAELTLGAVIRVGETELRLEPPSRPQPTSFEGIVTTDPSMREVFELVERVAPSSVPVAILGETGTGKELFAAAIHARSERSGGPFIPVNCAAISSELVESELFGHEKGAFTGAAGMRKGAFEEASGGTIFLDEIGELGLDLQAKLLRTLELGEIRRVGSSRPFRVDARVVCATHRDLRAAVKRGTFREDLYYRLCVIRLELPPLRRRAADVALLVEHFLAKLAPRGVRVHLEPAAMERLLRHPWPGNVRELRNVLNRALLLRRGPTIAGSDVAFDSTEPGSDAAAGTLAAEGDDSIRLPGKTLADIEAEAVLKSLRRNGGNRRAVARELSIARSTVQKRAQELGVPQPSGDADD